MPKSLHLSVATDPTNPLFGLLVYATSAGITFDTAGDDSVSERITDLTVLRLGTVLGIVAMGGQVSGFPAWVKIPSENINDPVPTYMPNREHTREDGVSVIRTWVDWHDEYHVNTTDDDGALFVQSNGFDEPLSGTVLAQLHSEGFTVLDTVAYLADVPQPE
jgi:hypothetical protein